MDQAKPQGRKEQGREAVVRIAMATGNETKWKMLKNNVSDENAVRKLNITVGGQH